VILRSPSWQIRLVQLRPRRHLSQSGVGAYSCTPPPQPTMQTQHRVHSQRFPGNGQLPVPRHHAKPQRCRGVSKPASSRRVKQHERVHSSIKWFGVKGARKGKLDGIWNSKSANRHLTC
jgi:hypothetical protein